MKADENKSEGKMELFHFSTSVAAGTNRQIIATTRGHEILMDVRKEWGGDDAGPTPPECLIIALGGCIINICRIMAMQKQIEVKDLRLSIAGDVDPSRAFGLDTYTRAGFSQLSVQVEFSSELSESEKEDFYQELLERCPLCDTINNPTPLQIRFS
ncbi:MAG: OsmC family protein [Syntrophobacterales bacterium]|jgi:putative redox protein|nr:OsmC family protein [Syntrophobacterales bacterium]